MDALDRSAAATARETDGMPVVSEHTPRPMKRLKLLLDCAILLALLLFVGWALTEWTNPAPQVNHEQDQ